MPRSTPFAIARKDKLPVGDRHTQRTQSLDSARSRGLGSPRAKEALARTGRSSPNSRKKHDPGKTAIGCEVVPDPGDGAWSVAPETRQAPHLPTAGRAGHRRRLDT